MIGKLSILIVAIIAGASSMPPPGGETNVIPKQELIPKPKGGKLGAFYIPVGTDATKCPEVNDNIANLVAYATDPFKCAEKEVDAKSCICETAKEHGKQYTEFSLVCAHCKKAAMAVIGEEAKFHKLMVRDELISSLGGYDGGSHMLIDPQVGFGPHFQAAFDLVSEMIEAFDSGLKAKLYTQILEKATVMLPEMAKQQVKLLEFFGIALKDACKPIVISWQLLLKHKIDYVQCLNTGELSQKDKEAAKQCDNGQGITPAQACQYFYRKVKEIKKDGLSDMAKPSFCVTLITTLTEQKLSKGQR